jgi:hypothetical protein
MDSRRKERARMFFGWRMVGAAFVVAMFAWAIGFYGPPIFLQTLHAGRGWPIPMISAAITSHFALGAAVIANLARLHRRFGVRSVTRAGAVLTAIGLLGGGWRRASWRWSPLSRRSHMLSHRSHSAPFAIGMPPPVEHGYLGRPW